MFKNELSVTTALIKTL